jgi:hypothetical protein
MAMLTLRASVRMALAAAAVALLTADPLAAQGFFDRIILRPTVITQPGAYVLGRSFDVSGAAPAIEIRAENVDLDLSGHTLSGNGSLQGVGILVDGAHNVRIRNGALDRFGIGIRVAGAHGVRLEDLEISGQDLGGAPPNVEIGVMIVNSRGVVLRDSVIARTFLGVFVRGGGSGGNRIEGNTLAGGANGGLGICYNPAPNQGDAGPQGDLVAENLVSRFGTGIATSAGSVGNIFRDNAIAYFMTAVSEATAGTNLFEGNTQIEIDP